MTSHLDEITSAYSGDDQELRLMIEQRALLAEMRQSPGWQAFKDLVYSHLAPIQGRMMRGRYETLQDYREDVGYVKGMTDAADRLFDQVERAIEARVAALTGEDADTADEYSDFSPVEGVDNDG